MKTPKHTPGPWFAESHSVFTKQGAYYIAETLFARNSFTKGSLEARANARLIASAPELLEACERMLTELTKLRTEWGGFRLDGEQLYSDLKEIIAKARGES